MITRKGVSKGIKGNNVFALADGAQYSKMFVLTIFMVVQFVLRETITGQESELNTLSAEIAAIAEAHYVNVAPHNPMGPLATAPARPPIRIAVTTIPLAKVPRAKS